MTSPKPIPICDDARQPSRHVWAEPFHDGDTCACGRFYLHLRSPHGFAAELDETRREEDEEP